MDTCCDWQNQMNMIQNIKKWNKEDLPICFDNWKLVPDGSKKDRVQQIITLMQDCDQIIHAGDRMMRDSF